MKCLTAALLVLLSVTLVEFASGQGQPIIDVHVHAFSARWSDEHTPFNSTTGEPSMATTGAELFPLTLAELKRNNIKLAVLSGPLETVREWRAQATGSFIGAPLFPMAYLDISTTWRLSRYAPKVDEVREAHRTGEIGVIGEITAQYAGLSPGDPILEPFWDLAEELAIPVGIHTGTGPPGGTRLYPDRRVGLGNPILLDDLLAQRPDLRLYLMHAGYPYLQETIAILHMYPQVHADLSAINWRIPRAAFQRYLRSLVVAGFGKRLMFGSDSEAWPEAIGLAIEAIDSAEFLSKEQRADIFYNNAARFLRLTDDEIAKHHTP